MIIILYYNNNNNNGDDYDYDDDNDDYEVWIWWIITDDKSDNMLQMINDMNEIKTYKSITKNI